MKPYLKYPGAKTRVANTIKRYFPKAERLIEPFVGSGALFLATKFERYLLADTNAAIINAHQVAMNSPTSLLDALDELFSPGSNTELFYKQIVARFNNYNLDPVTKAAYTIYINRHCFNGLWRVNQDGHYNNSFGGLTGKKDLKVPATEIAGFYNKCQRCTVEILCQDFELTMSAAGSGDIVYCDPPYIPLSSTANFTAYSEPFGMDEQYRLTECAKAAAGRGAVVFISNHDCALSRKVYADAQIIDGIMVKRNISADATARKKVAELLAVYSERPIPIWKQTFMFAETEKAA